MENEKIGFVLSGGGAKGAFEMGVWRYLDEALKISDKITGFSGTSVGAINTALILSESSMQAKIQTWNDFTSDDLVDFKNLIHLIKDLPFRIATNNSKTIAKDFLSGFSSQKGIYEALKQLEFDTTKLNKLDVYSGITYFHNTLHPKTNYESWKNKSKEDIEDIVLTSSALPFIYPSPKNKDGNLQFDGGFIPEANTPIEPLYEYDNYRKFIVVYLMNKNNKKLHDLIEYENNHYKGIEICRIIPDGSFDDSFDATLLINEELTQERISQGIIAAWEKTNHKMVSSTNVSDVLNFEKIN